ncbi:MAG: hypothetical protein IJN63_00825 [Clostridia bacterium]|nr:hypothetical protein [Clostridia bacterium]
MRFNRIIAGILAALMCAGSFALPTFADEGDAILTTAPGATEGETAEGEPTEGETTEEVEGFKGEIFEEFQDYTKLEFKTVEDKLNTMKKMVWNDRYELYVEPWTGEVFCYDTVTGQVLSTNPYDLYSTGTTERKRKELLSQIIIKYTDTTGTSKEYLSYEDAAEMEQIVVKEIKGGVRIEYTIGRSQSSFLVPRSISVERFETLIMANIPGGPEWLASGATAAERDDSLLDFKAKQFYYKYLIYDPTDPTNPERVLADMYSKYPVTKKKNLPIYVLTSDIVNRELLVIESYIKEYCPEYNFEELEKDHAETEYTGNAVEPALFKLALEYKLTDTGMTVSLPANGIRYDETNYTLEELQVLPFLGAGDNQYTGYNFLPDGSGAITRFEDYVGKSVNLAGDMYGIDYAYLMIEGTKSQTMRLPVFGIVENTSKTERVATEVEMERVLEDGTIEKYISTSYSNVTTTTSKGFLAIIEEGDALTSIMSTSGGTTHKYYSIITKFEPRPKDQYNLAGSISVGSSSMITVVSERKYVGKLTFNLIMLNDEKLAKDNGLENYYEASWVGMAKAYREYLEKKGVLTRLIEETTKKDIPLYIESFGVIPTTEKILSMPVEVDVALTSFEDIKTMYDELAAEGITNINFKLSGYANGNMYGRHMPGKLKWEKAVGGNDGFADLVAYAKEKGFGIYPDFSFTSVVVDEMFDGFSLKKHAAKTIDDRYVYKVVFTGTSDVPQYDGILVSPSAYSEFYDKFTVNYAEYGLNSIALSTMGTDLNSDFDTDEPFNREDTKLLVTQFLDKVKSEYSSILGEGGNAYTLKYFDHLLNVSLDSSRYALTSAAVPFVGLVLHGYINFAGTPINMEGDIDYALLKAIESGSSIYFILNYDNTELLKESTMLSRYFAVRYDITKSEVIEQYNKLNAAIGDLQTTLITDHQFMRGERVADPDEVEADLLAAQQAADELYEKSKLNAYKNAVLEYRKKYEAGEIPAGTEIVYEVPEKQAPVVLVGGPKRDESGNILTNSTTGEFEYTTTKYTSDDGSIVKVTYGDSVSFIINYNNFKVTVWDDDGKEYTVDSYSFIKIN